MEKFIGFDRVRRHTPEHVNEQIDALTQTKMERLAAQDEGVIIEEMTRLDYEWDVDRALMLTFSILGSTFFALGMTRNRKFLGVLSAQLMFLGLHAAAGWCPPVSVFRRLGFRTKNEINAEKIALRALSGESRLKAA